MIIMTEFRTVPRSRSEEFTEVIRLIPPFDSADYGWIVMDDKGDFGLAIVQCLVVFRRVVKVAQALVDVGAGCEGIVGWPVFEYVLDVPCHGVVGWGVFGAVVDVVG